MKIEFSKESINKKLSKLKKDKNFNLYAAAGMFVLLILFVLLFQQIRIWTAPPSSQSDYPVLPERKDDDMAMRRDVGIDELSARSDLVALVEIEKIYDISDVTYTPEEGSAEKDVMDKQGISSFSFKMRRVDLKVKTMIKGEEKRKTISVWEHEDLLYLLPEFKPGDEFIFFMLEYDSDGGYVHSNSESIFYLAQDNKVYPARLTNLLSETSGMNYNDFKDRVKNHKPMDEIWEELKEQVS